MEARSFQIFIFFVCIVLRLVALGSIAAHDAPSERADSGIHKSSRRAHHYHLVQHKKGAAVAPSASSSPAAVHHHHHTSPDARPAAHETRNRNKRLNSNSRSSGAVPRGVRNSRIHGSPAEMNRHKRARIPAPAPIQRARAVVPPDQSPLVAKVVQGLQQASQYGAVARVIESLPVAIIRPGITLFAPNDRSLAGAQFSGNSGLALLSFHIVTRRLEFAELSAVREGTKLSTMLDGISVVVSHKNSTTVSQIDNALIIEPDMYVDDDVAVHGVDSVFDAFAYNKLPSMESRQPAIEEGNLNVPVADVFPPDTTVFPPDHTTKLQGSVPAPSPLIGNEPDSTAARVPSPSAPLDLNGHTSHEHTRESISTVSSAVTHLQKGFIFTSLTGAAISIVAASIFS